MGRFFELCNELPPVPKLVEFCQRAASRRALQFRVVSCRAVPYGIVQLSLGFCSSLLLSLSLPLFRSRRGEE